MLSSILDLNMNTIKVHHSELNGNWIQIAEYNYEYIPIGSVIKIKNFDDHDECTKLMFFDPSMNDCSLGLVIISGEKAGTIFVYLPIDAYYKNTRMLDTKWFLENYTKWVSPSNSVFEVEFLYQAICNS